jgi:hypothetical protein
VEKPFDQLKEWKFPVSDGKTTVIVLVIRGRRV